MKTKQRRLLYRRKILARIAEHKHRYSLKRKILKKRRSQADSILFHQWSYYRKQAKNVRTFKDTINMFMPQSLRYLIECDKGDFSFSKMKNIRDSKVYIIKIPKVFSIIENPKESYSVIVDVMNCFLSQKVSELQLDYIHCEKIDLVTMVFLDAILKDIDNYWTKCTRANVLMYCRLKSMGGKNYMDNNVCKMMNSVGSPDVITNRKSYYKGVIPFRLCSFDANDATVKDKLERKDLDTTMVLDYINDCLHRFNKKMSAEATQQLGVVVGETLINAEEHSSTRYRYMIGYMEEDDCAEEENHSGVFNFVIMNFGQTIYEKFKSPRNASLLNNMCMEQMKELSSKFTRRRFFRANFTEEVLWTLYTLQQGVTCVPEKRRGNGTVQFIENFFKLKGSDKIDDTSRMYIMSGNTMIEFDGTYRLVNIKDEAGSSRDVISFNDSGSLDEAPDSKYVRSVDHYFPGTAIFVRLLLNEDDIINKHGNN